MISKVTKYLGEDNSSEIVLIPFPADYSPETTPLNFLTFIPNIFPLSKIGVRALSSDSFSMF